MIEYLNQLLPGLAAVPNLHPLVVHFPLALYPSFLLLELIAVPSRSEPLRHAASWMLYLGTLGATAAVLAGFQAEETVEHSEEVHVILEQHETYGLVVMGLGLFLSLWRLAWRSRFSRWLQIPAALVLVAAMVEGADLGGLMVYQHAVAVRLPCPAAPEEPVAEPEPPMPPEAPMEQPDAGAPPGEPKTPAPRPHAHTHSRPHTHTHPHKR